MGSAPLRLLVVVALAACSPSTDGRTPIPVEAPVLESASWEREFAPSEMVVYREGSVVAAPAGDGEEDDHERPLAGARVDLLVPRPGGGGPLEVAASTVSDAEGRFRVGPGAPSNWVLSVSHEGYTTTVGGRNADYAGSVLFPAGGEVKLVLRPALTRSGTLLDESGKPLPDGLVVAFGEAYHEEVRTGPDGRFVFHPPAASIRLEAAGERFSRVQASIDAATDRDVELRAVRRGVVRGRVVELETGRPLAGALVVWDGLPHEHTRADGMGRFEIQEPRNRLLGPGPEGRLAALASGWGWRSIALPPVGDVELRLQRGTSASGRVLDGDGQPVAGARILAVSSAWDRAAELVRGPLTAADGTFALDWLPRRPRGARDGPRLVAHRRGMGTSDAAEMPADGAPVELVLPGERIVKGRVVRASGAGIPDLPLELSWPSWGLRGAAAARLPLEPVIDGGTNQHGSFEMHGAPLDTEARLRAFVDGGFLDTVLAPGDTASVRVVLDGGGVLSGRLVDVNGEALDASGTVTALATDHEVFTHIERRAEFEGGVFRLTDLPDTTYVVSAEVPDMIVPSATARVGDDLRLVASRLGRLVVRLVFPEGVDPEPIVVRFDRDGSAAGGRRIEFPADVQTASRRVQAGVFDLDASGGVWRGRAEDVHVGDGEDRVVDLPLERTMRVRARLFDADGRPLPGGRVRLFSIDDPTRRPEALYSDESGWLDVTGLTLGRWEARVVLADRAPLRQVIRTDDLPEVLELRLPPHGALRIEVRTPDGQPVAGAVLDLATSDGTPVDAWAEGARQLGSRYRSDDAGRALVRGVGVGRVVVTARRGTHRLGRVEVDVAPGKTNEVTIN